MVHNPHEVPWSVLLQSLMFTICKNDKGILFGFTGFKTLEIPLGILKTPLDSIMPKYHKPASEVCAAVVWAILGETETPQPSYPIRASSLAGHPDDSGPRKPFFHASLPPWLFKLTIPNPR